VTTTGVAKKAATLVVVDSSSTRSRVSLGPSPFHIGRNVDNHLVLRDSRVSRNHARISYEEDAYFLEDLQSSHGTWLNGTRINRQALQNGDKIEFGVPDSYTLYFSYDGDDIHRLLEQFPDSGSKVKGDLGKLRALVEVARALHNSLSTRDVLGAVVDACLAVTGFDRGFLFLKKQETIEVAVARDQKGRPLASSELEMPVHTIERALNRRRDLLSMCFDIRPEDFDPASSVAALKLRSVVCVPLVRIQTQSGEETRIISTAQETIGLIYLDSKSETLDLASGNQELLQTLALEASTILENARLLEEERNKQRMEEELEIARSIQQSLLPRSLPSTGWFRARGFSIPSHAVGGDYFDVKQIHDEAWSAVIADVSGKGVSSALLASLLQGALLAPAEGEDQLKKLFRSVDHYMYDRTGGEKYATLFYATIDFEGRLRYVNAGHCRPVLIRTNTVLEELDTTGLPLGMLGLGQYSVEEKTMYPGDKLVAYTDGLSEATDRQGRFYGTARLEAVLKAYANAGVGVVHEALRQDINRFTAGAEQFDDITLLVLEYAPSRA
jgi:phosphoserine phosphatase RsbU/P